MVLHTFTLARGRQRGKYGWAGPLGPVCTWFNAANMSILLDVVLLELARLGRLRDRDRKA